MLGWGLSAQLRLRPPRHRRRPAHGARAIFSHVMTPVLKRIEQGWRRAWIAAIVGLLRARSDRTVPDWSKGSHRVLFLRHDRIGDMIVTTGVLRAIARSHPTIELDVLASPANAPIIRTAPWL